MDSDKRPSSPIKLQDYVEILRLAANGELENLHNLKDDKRRLAKELKDEGLISDARVDIGRSGIVQSMVITPSGAMALESWSTFLKESSVLYKIKENAGRLFWVVVGAAVASASEIINCGST